MKRKMLTIMTFHIMPFQYIQQSLLYYCKSPGSIMKCKMNKYQDESTVHTSNQQNAIDANSKTLIMQALYSRRCIFSTSIRKGFHLRPINHLHGSHTTL